MKKLKTLVKRILSFEPTYVINGPFGDTYATYQDKKYEYSINLCENNFINLSVHEINPYKWLNNFEIELTEREYMEIKWKIEEWEKAIEEKQIDKFEEFVNGFSNNAMDELLNE